MKWYEVECRNEVVVILGDTGASVITDSTGNEPQLINPQWRPTRVLSLGPDISVLFLEQKVQHGIRKPEDHIETGRRDSQVERTTGWLLTNGNRFGAIVDGIDDNLDLVNLRKTVAEAFAGEMLCLLTTPSDSVLPEQAMRLGEREVLRRLLARLDIKSALTLKPLEEFVGGEGVNFEMIYFGAKQFGNFTQGLINPNVISVEILQGMAVTQVRHVPLDDSLRDSAHLCWTNASTCKFFIVFSYKKKPGKAAPESFVLLPDRRAIFGEDFSSEKAVAFLDRVLVNLFLMIISSNVRPLSSSYRSPDRGGLLLSGLKNFGHGIWEELHAIERALQVKSRWNNLPVFYVHKEGGAALYRPLEHLYPELEGRFVYLDTMQDIVNHAFVHGIQLFRRKGSLAMRATRDRLTGVARLHGESRALDAAKAKTIRQQRPVVAFGLRMSNRHPVDALGFYVRLTEALLKRFGRLSVIFDGMNVDPDTEKPAAPVFSAASDGRHEIDLESDFVDRFRSAVSNLPVQIQSCVGLPIRENLFWLSQADFFVAPNGGGLAKLRWALDIPGYVLTSSINLKYCHLVNAYGDNRSTEEPFTPIYMNTPDEVEDVPVQPPRLKRPKVRAVPYPENFVVFEDKVIPQICDLIDISLKKERLKN